MKVGSLVECVDNTGYADLVKQNKAYTVRQIINNGEMLFCGFNKNGLFTTIECREYGIYLEEVISPLKEMFGADIELPFPMKDFRELLPNIINEVEEIFELEFVEL